MPEPHTLTFHQDQDGTFVILFRVEAPGAHALRLRFEDLHLPADAALTVYGWTREQGVTNVTGPYRGTGPNQTGELATPSIAGSQAVVELHLRKHLAQLPFHLAAVEVLNALDEAAAPPHKFSSAEKRRSWFRGAIVEHSVIEGEGVLEGDILLGPADALIPAGKEDVSRGATTVTNPMYLWPNGVIPYVIDAGISDQKRITDAISHWNTRLSGHIRIIPRTTETAYLRFVRPASDSTCSSYIGNYRIAGQPVNIGNYCSTGNTIHEIGHAIGLFHEHTRQDRDAYIKINFQNISSDAASNFNAAPGAGLPTAYDYNSIMHYGAYAFSSNGLPTIETIPAGISIGQRDGLSAGDIAGTKAMYPAQSSGDAGSEPLPVPQNVNITLTSTPSGRTIVVDGQNVTTPATFSWAPGSQHTISAQTLNEGASRYLFLGWQDGGSASRVYVTPSTPSTLTANFTAQHRLSVAAQGGGAISVYPYSADGFYTEGSPVTVYAQIPTGLCFAGWTGLLPVPEPIVNLVMNQPQTAVANFTSGALTVNPRVVMLTAAGQTSPLSVTANSGCAWNASSQSPWITIEGPSAGSGSGVVTIRVTQNSGVMRYGAITINALGVVVRQDR